VKFFEFDTFIFLLTKMGVEKKYKLMFNNYHHKYD